MNTHIFQTMINWEKLAGKKSFRHEIQNNNELQNEIEKLKEPVSHIEEFLKFSWVFYLGTVCTQIGLFLLRKGTIASAIFSVIFMSAILFITYIWKNKKNQKVKQAQIEKNQTILDSYAHQINQDIYNLENFELMDSDYLKYCVKHGLQKQYDSFKMGVLKQHLENHQIIAFFDFMEYYCKENINNTPISNLQVKTANSQGEKITFFA